MHEPPEHKGRICLLLSGRKAAACLCVLWSQEGFMVAGGVYAHEERGQKGEINSDP